MKQKIIGAVICLTMVIVGSIIITVNYINKEKDLRTIFTHTYVKNTCVHGNLVGLKSIREIENYPSSKVIKCELAILPGKDFDYKLHDMSMKDMGLIISDGCSWRTVRPVSGVPLTFTEGKEETVSLEFIFDKQWRMEELSYYDKPSCKIKLK